tara:strand:+ start:113 stop:739 length:627 start_codon:yes stop_codon:yes gene_type:complete
MQAFYDPQKVIQMSFYVTDDRGAPEPPTPDEDLWNFILEGVPLCGPSGTSRSARSATEIERLVSEGANPNVMGLVYDNETGRSIYTPALVMAVRWTARLPAVRAICGSCTVAVEALVRLGANINATDEYGRTALMHAAMGGRVAAARALLAAGANHTLRATGGLRNVCRGKNALEMVRYILTWTDQLEVKGSSFDDLAVWEWILREGG